MNITRYNCESYFLDYYEKNLSPVGVAEVLFFLEEHPDMKDVFESYEAVFLDHERINFPDKEALKKKYSKEELDFILSSEITIHNCEQFFIAHAEKILSELQIQKLNSFLAQHAELKKDFELFQKCILSPNLILFEGKDLLKRSPITVLNREEFFVRAIENDLSTEEQKQLDLFLQKNQEYQKEFDLFKQTILPQEKTNFDYKNQLRKEEITTENREEYFVRAIEQDLNSSEQQQLALFLKNHPEYTKELEFFKHTLLVPEQTIFKYKSELKKRERKPVIISLFSQRSSYYAAAAAVLILAGLFFFFRSNDNSAIYFAGKTNSAARNVILEDPGKMKNEDSAIASGTTQKETGSINTENESPASRTNISVKKKAATTGTKPTEEKNNYLLAPSESKTEEAIVAEKDIPEQIGNTVLANNSEIKNDSVAPLSIVPNEVVASVANPQAKTDEYQTVAAVVNKKLRSMLGIKKSTDCETSDKIGVWDLAMVAKKGVQKIIGAKTLDVNKVCEGTGDKVEYVFTAGNFEISKSVSK